MLINRIFIATAVVTFIMYLGTADACPGSPSTPPTIAIKPNRCEKHGHCRDFEQCLTSKCTDICDFELVQHAKNAVCNTKRHVPIYTCPEGYKGNPYRKCTKQCLSHEECINTDVCHNGFCVHGCETFRWMPNKYCRSKNHVPQYHIIAR